jgi:formylglycine-generating enzyme required for sulfatase activity
MGLRLLGWRTGPPSLGDASGSDAEVARRLVPLVSLSAPAAGAMPLAGAGAASKAPCPVGMKMVAGGSFVMGSDDDAFDLWSPAHQVTLDTFCLDIHEVTVQRYAECTRAGGCTPAASRPSYPKGGGASKKIINASCRHSPSCATRASPGARSIRSTV